MKGRKRGVWAGAVGVLSAVLFLAVNNPGIEAVQANACRQAAAPEQMATMAEYARAHTRRLNLGVASIFTWEADGDRGTVYGIAGHLWVWRGSERVFVRIS